MPGDRADLVAELTERTSQALLSLATPILGFAAMMVGGFSRLGSWRQVVFAIVGVIVLDLLDNVAMSLVRETPGAWWVAGLPALAGLAASGLLLWIASRPRRLGARPAATGVA